MTTAAPVIHERDARDFYRTPAYTIASILPHLRGGGTALDPCAGDGAILDALRKSGRWGCVAGIELDPMLAAKAPACIHADALAMSWARPDSIVMNPPFKHALEFLEKALAEVGPNGEVAALLKLAFMASKGRKAFHDAHPSDVFVLSKRPSFAHNATDKGQEYGWFRFGHGAGGTWRVI